MEKFSPNKLKRSLTELRRLSLHATRCVQMGDRDQFDTWLWATKQQIGVIEALRAGWTDGS